MTSQKFLWKALRVAMGEAFLQPLTPFLCKNRLSLSLLRLLLGCKYALVRGWNSDENSP